MQRISHIIYHITSVAVAEAPTNECERLLHLPHTLPTPSQWTAAITIDEALASLPVWVQAHGVRKSGHMIRRRAAARTPGTPMPPYELDWSGISTSVGSALSAAEARHKNVEHSSIIFATHLSHFGLTASPRPGTCSTLDTLDSFTSWPPTMPLSLLRPSSLSLLIESFSTVPLE